MINKEVLSYTLVYSQDTKVNYTNLFILILSIFINFPLYAQNDKIDRNSIPMNLPEAVEQLSIMLHDTPKQQILSKTEDEFTVNQHFGLGLWIRNSCGLWQDSKLKDYFNSIGVFHPDEMSFMILTSYYRKLRDKNWDFDRYLKYYEDRWNDQKHLRYKIPDSLPLREHDKN